MVRWLRVMHRPGRPWSHLAVLARTNARLGPIAAALERCGIPFRVGPVPAAGAEMRQVISVLRAMPPTRPLRSALADLSIPDERGGPDEGRAPGHRTGVSPGTPGGPGLAGIPPALSRLADEHAVEDPGASVGAFLAWVAPPWAMPRWPRSSIPTPTAWSCPPSTGPKASNGRPWPWSAWRTDSSPSPTPPSPAAKAEERRLLYVAITRAEEHLWCSWARQRQSAGRSWTCRPSPLLDAIESAARTAEPTIASMVPSHMAALRRRLPAAG